MNMFSLFSIFYDLKFTFVCFDSQTVYRSCFFHPYNLQHTSFALRIFFWTLRKIQAIHNAGFIKATWRTAVSQIILSVWADISIAKERSKVDRAVLSIVELSRFAAYTANASEWEVLWTKNVGNTLR